MVNEFVIDLGLKYLNDCIANDQQATLSEMIDYIDCYERLVANLDEVNEILRRHPSIFVRHDSGKVELGTDGSESTITEEELDFAIVEYKTWFDTELKKLNK